MFGDTSTVTTTVNLSVYLLLISCDQESFVNQSQGFDMIDLTSNELTR